MHDFFLLHWASPEKPYQCLKSFNLDIKFSGLTVAGTGNSAAIMVCFITFVTNCSCALFPVSLTWRLFHSTDRKWVFWDEQDFYNLVDVYLDAVFHPRCVNEVQTFQQEGWHYELNDPSEDITYKGKSCYVHYELWYLRHTYSCLFLWHWSLSWSENYLKGCTSTKLKLCFFCMCWGVMLFCFMLLKVLASSVL